jgi:hypothetical protein
MLNKDALFMFFLYKRSTILIDSVKIQSKLSLATRSILSVQQVIPFKGITHSSLSSNKIYNFKVKVALIKDKREQTFETVSLSCKI